MKIQTSQNKKTYSAYNNKLKSVLKKAEKEHYQQCLEKCSDNLKKTWSIIKDALNINKSSKINDTFKYNNNITTDKNFIANKFNDYFVNVGNTLAASIPKEGPSYKFFLPPSNSNSIFLEATTYDEIKRIISNMKNNATGHDKMTLNDTKPVYETLIHP